MFPIVRPCSSSVNNLSADLLKCRIAAGRVALQSWRRLRNPSAMLGPSELSVSSFDVISAMMEHTSKLAFKATSRSVTAGTRSTVVNAMSVLIATVEYGLPKIEQQITSRTRRLLKVRSLLESAGCQSGGDCWPQPTARSDLLP